MRLTQKADKEHEHLKMCIGWYELPTKDYHIRIINETPNQMYQKLGQLEDIEEELGIDLITLVKALKQETIFVKTRLGIKETIKDGDGWAMKTLKNENGKLFIFADIFFLDDIMQRDILTPIQLYLQDYGKTWALTKEELL